VKNQRGRPNVFAEKKGSGEACSGHRHSDKKMTQKKKKVFFKKGGWKGVQRTGGLAEDRFPRGENNVAPRTSPNVKTVQDVGEKRHSHVRGTVRKRTQIESTQSAQRKPQGKNWPAAGNN